MFKEIFASVLLTTSIGTPIIQSRNDSGYSTALEGAYTIREDIGDTFIARLLNPFVEETYEFTLDNNDIRIGWYYSNLDTYYYTDINYQFNWYLDGLEIETNFNWIEDYGGTVFSTYYDADRSFDSLSLNQKTFIVYFGNTYFLESRYLPVWNAMFTKQGNSYNQVYTGWYTFNNSLNFTGISDFNVYGNITINNNLYNSISRTTGTLDSYYYNVITNANDSFNIWKNGSFNVDFKVHNSYLQGVMIPYFYKPYLQQLGTFGYIAQPVQYDFADMIFNVVDAPIYMLSQLFSFELFGIQLYVAFMGVLTLLLMMFLVRKMI